MTDWKIFKGDGTPHTDLAKLPDPPPWRFSRPMAPQKAPAPFDAEEEKRARPFIASAEMVEKVNAALYLRRPLLITGRPGTGKSTLIAKVAHELMLGKVLRWSITSRSTLRGGLYDYDAVSRLQASGDEPAAVEAYLTLAPLGTALIATDWPRALLIDEIDKSDLDFANDLLNVIDDGTFDIPELRRLGAGSARVRTYDGEDVTIIGGKIVSRQFPVVIMTSNGEREFPPAFLRRCIRLNIKPPTPEELGAIIKSHLGSFAPKDAKTITTLIDAFDKAQNSSQIVSVDQLLNAVFLTFTVANQDRQIDDATKDSLRVNLMHALDGSE